MQDESLYESIAAELASNQQQPGIWLKALVDADGREDAARLIYTRLRLADLRARSSGPPTAGLPGRSWWQAFLARWAAFRFRRAARTWYARLLWISAGLMAFGFLAMTVLQITGIGIKDPSSPGWFGLFVLVGMVLGTGTAVTWLVSRTNRGWRKLACALLGTLLGFGGGVALVLAAFLTNPGHRYGEMAGVAGLGYGIIFGGPVGALTGFLVGLWIGFQQTRTH
jgi:hypothetical protein